jgi:hypothetical protein
MRAERARQLKWGALIFLGAMLARALEAVTAQALPLQFAEMSVAGVLANCARALPTFLHVVAMSLLSLSVIRWTRTSAHHVCMFWAGVHAGLEALTHPAIQHYLGTNAPSALIRLLQHLEDLRFGPLSGGFHGVEVWAALAGGAAAYALVRRPWRRPQQAADASGSSAKDVGRPQNTPNDAARCLDSI